VKSLDDGQPGDTPPDPSHEDDDAFAEDGSLNHFFYTLHMHITQGKDLKPMDRGNTSDPYVKCKLLYCKNAEAELEAEAAVSQPRTVTQTESFVIFGSFDDRSVCVTGRGSSHP
jgi:hypothetical protein